MSNDLDATLPVPELEAYSGAAGDGTLPDLECEATMESRSIRSGDYFNDYTLNLPVPELEASFGHRASMDAKLPALEGEARTGSIASGNLPYLEATATGSAGHVGRLDKKLPTMSLTATMGARLDKKLPAVTLEAEMSTPVLMRLNKKLPAIQGEATVTGATATLDKIICFPKITATAGQDNTATVNGNLPAIQCAATVKSGQIMTLDATLPELRGEANSYSAVINLDAYLPTVTSGVASGSDYGGTGSTISGDRFDDTLLRFERWA